MEQVTEREKQGLVNLAKQLVEFSNNIIPKIDEQTEHSIKEKTEKLSMDIIEVLKELKKW